jgi:hypothetical protein
MCVWTSCGAHRANDLQIGYQRETATDRRPCRLAIGVGLTILYFSLATFFEVNAKALDAKALSVIQKAAEIGNEKAKDLTAPDKRNAG